MRGTTFIMPSEDGVEIGNTLIVDFGDTAKESGILSESVHRVNTYIMSKTYEVLTVSIIAVAGSHNARVDTSSVCLPCFQIESSGYIAGADIDVLIFDMNRDTFLVLDDIGTVVLASDEVRTIGDFGCENARSVFVACEEGGRVGGLGVTQGGHVVVDLLEGLESREITFGLIRSYLTNEFEHRYARMLAE